jgi:hypothetical protein
MLVVLLGTCEKDNQNAGYPRARERTQGAKETPKLQLLAQ